MANNDDINEWLELEEEEKKKQRNRVEDTQTAQTVISKGKVAAGKAAAGANKVLGKFFGTAAVVVTAKAVIITVLTLVAIVLLILILIGIITFIFMGPDLIRAEFTKKVDTIWSSVKGIFIGQAEASVTKEQIIDVAQYLENMGYDLHGYGFGKVEKDKNTGEITDIESENLLAYLASDNKTYMVESSNFTAAFKNLISNTTKFGNGMLVLNDNVVKGGSVEIDREKKLMNIQINDITYQYNMDGWSGRYGKPIEFLLALHTGTMAPEFALQVATHPELETKVYIRFHRAETKVELRYKGGTLDDWSDFLKKVKISMPTATEQDLKEHYGINNIDISVGKDYEKKNSSYTYIPYIWEVTNHWYKNVSFKDSYVKGADKTTKTVWNQFDVLTTVTGQLYQVKDGIEEDHSSIIDSLFEREYHIADGINDLEDTKKSKIKVLDSMQYALTMLENVHSEDAEYILRDLRHWLKRKGYKFQDEYIVTDPEKVAELQRKRLEDAERKLAAEGSYTDSKPNYLNRVLGNNSEQINYEGDKATIRTSELEEGTEVYSPVAGTVMNKSETTLQIKVSSPSNLEGCTVIMSGFKVDGTIRSGSKISNAGRIGTTIAGQDIEIRLFDANKTAMNVQDNLGQRVTYSKDLLGFLLRKEGTGPTEGNNYIVYNAQDGVTTVGMGITFESNKDLFAKYGITELKVGDRLSQDIVDKIAAERLERDRKYVIEQTNGLNLTSYQIDALVSRKYNTGNIDGFREAYTQYGNTTALWDNYMSKPITAKNGNPDLTEGLKNRREAEWKLFTTGNYSA